MKVEGPRKSSGTSGASKSGGARNGGDGSFSGLIDEGAGAAENRQVAGAGPLGRLDALLALQEMPDAASEEARKRAKKRGLELLDALDGLRMGLMTGDVSAETLHRLEHMIGQRRDKVDDPELAAVLDEIDLRVQVELAKFEMA
jgi:hypothetical protein